MYRLIFLLRSDNKIYACVRPSFLFADHYAEAFKAYFLFFLMSTVISHNEFVSLA